MNEPPHSDCDVRIGATASGVWSYLHMHAVELCFIGASVTVQRDGWCTRLLEYLRTQTGLSHTARFNAMGGVGLLFGVANYSSPRPTVTAGIAFVEFSTGDVNPGLTPLKELPTLLRSLLRQTTADYRYTVIVHNWRADFVGVSSGVRETYDSIASEFDVPVIHNDVLAERAIQSDPATQAEWFRDVCHTNPPGADAYARHVLACLRELDAQPDCPAPVCKTAPDFDPLSIRFAELGDLDKVPGCRSGDYTYSGTGQNFKTVEVEAGRSVRLSCSGQLMGIAFISGPRSGKVVASVKGKVVRRFGCFDRYSHYSRYILLPWFIDLADEGTFELVCLDEPVDRALPAKEHPDFDLPRTMTLVHLAGARLKVDLSDVTVSDSPLRIA